MSIISSPPKKSTRIIFVFVKKYLTSIIIGEITMIDRSEVSRALAKAIAYKQCGKDADAAEWVRKLVTLLECAEILREI